MERLYGLCLTCKTADAVCDDHCVACEVEFLRANPDEYEPDQTASIRGQRVHLWSQPFWREVAHQFEATPEWQAHCDKALDLYEELAVRGAA